jgi:hypothetical protein
MDPSDLYAQTLSALTSARSTMLSASWQASMANQPQAVRVQAAHQLGDLQSAINTLSNKSLSDIANEMQDNAAGLTQSTQALTDALKGVTQVQNIMAAVTGILNVVAKVAPLV